MTPQINEFNKLAAAVITDATQRSRIIAAAVAVAVANQASLPTAAVDSPAIYFASTVMSAAVDRVSELNEKLIFDCKQAVEWARTMWLVRYGAAHPVSKPVFATSHSFFECLAGVPSAVAPEATEFFNTNKVAILALASNLCEMLRVKDGRDRA